MNRPQIYCQAVARAIGQLDQCSFRGPDNGQDKHDWDEARRRLIGILDRNGFELAGQRIKRTSTRKA
jgi:hypothetical protein